MKSLRGPQISRGSLLFWKTTEIPGIRIFDLPVPPQQPVIQPLYLLDGQQRLTALSRALGNDPMTEIVFNVETEAFQNQSAATAKDPRWVKVREVVQPKPPILRLVRGLQTATSLVDAVSFPLHTTVEDHIASHPEIMQSPGPEAPSIELHPSNFRARYLSSWLAYGGFDARRMPIPALELLDSLLSVVGDTEHVHLSDCGCFRGSCLDEFLVLPNRSRKMRRPSTSTPQTQQSCPMRNLIAAPLTSEAGCQPAALAEAETGPGRRRPRYDV